MPRFEHVQVGEEGPVARLELHRPDRLNALSPALLQELIAAAGRLDATPGVKAVVVRGAGGAFCAGADLDAIATGDRPGRAREAADLGRRMADAVGGMRPLSVAAVHGHCVGGGVVLAAACDLRIAARSARFSIPEVDLGIPLGWGGIPRLVRELGPALTKELVLTCRPFGAEEAAAWRFVNQVVEDGDLDVAAERLAARLTSQPAYVLELTKRQVNAVAEEAGSTAAARRDADAIAGALADPESREHMARYLAERGRGAGR